MMYSIIVFWNIVIRVRGYVIYLKLVYKVEGRLNILVEKNLVERFYIYY